MIDGRIFICSWKFNHGHSSGRSVKHYVRKSYTRVVRVGFGSTTVYQLLLRVLTISGTTRCAAPRRCARITLLSVDADGADENVVFRFTHRLAVVLILMNGLRRWINSIFTKHLLFREQKTPGALDVVIIVIILNNLLSPSTQST